MRVTSRPGEEKSVNDKSEKSLPSTEDGKRPQMGKWIGIGVGAGIGSAAVAAALLYSGSLKKKSDRG